MKKLIYFFSLLISFNVITAQINIENIAQFNGSSGSTDAASKLLIDSEENVYAIGTSSDGVSSFILIRKYSTSGNLIWENFFSSRNNGKDFVITAGIDSSGNIIIGGSSYNTTYDLLLVKYDPNGIRLWQRFYDGSANSYDVLNSLCIDNFGNIYVSATITFQSKDIGVLKFSPNGNLLWEEFYSSSSSSDDIPNDIKLDKNNFIYVTGSVYNGAITLKYDPAGNNVWTKIHNEPGGSSAGNSLVIDDSLNVFVTGTVRPSGQMESYLLIRYNETGDVNWVRKYNPENTTNYVNYYAKKIVIDNDQDLYITGYGIPIITDKGIFGSVIVTIKYNRNGDTLWTSGFNSGTPSVLENLSICLSGVDQIVISSYKENTPSYYDLLIYKLDSSGVEEWSYTNENRGDDRFTDVLSDSKGNLFSGGYLGKNGSLDLIIMKFSEDGQPLWEKTYNSAGFSSDNFSSAVKDNNGNYFVSGFNNSEYIIVKYNSSIQKIWATTFTDSADISGPKALRIACDSLGNLFATCIVNMNDRINIKLFKFSNTGNFLWSRVYTSSGNSIIEPKAVLVDKNQNAVIMGSDYNTSSLDFKIVILKYSQDGNLVLEKIHNNSTAQNSDRGGNMKLDEEDNIYIVGSYGGTTLTLKLNQNGNQIWERLYTNGQPYVKSLSDQYIDNKGNVYVAGYIGVQNQGYNYLSIKYDSSGDQKWVNTFNGLRGEDDFARVIIADSSGNVYVTGESMNNTSNFSTSIVTFKYDSTGNISWSKELKGLSNSYLSPSSMILDDFSNIYILNGKPNYPQYGYLTVKYKPNGDSAWSFNYTPYEGITNYGSALFIDHDYNVIISGKAYGQNTSYDIITIKLSQIIGINNSSVSIPDKFVLSQNYPNPFNPKTIIKYELGIKNIVSLKVYDVLGNEVRTLVNEVKPPGRHEIEFDGKDLSSGVYFYKLTTGDFVETKRMILLK